jgi:hypothetical protein
VHRVSDVRQLEIHTAEPLVPDPSPFEVEIAIENLKRYKSPGVDGTLREEHRLRVFENRVLRRIFGLRRDEVTGDWRKLCNEELHNL